MKIRKLFTMAALMLLTPAVMTSCLGSKDDDQMKVTTTFSSFFNAITDMETGETVLYPGVSYTLETQMQAPKATLKIEGLKLPNGSSYPSLLFTDVPWKTNTRGWTEISLSNVQPEGVGGFMLTPTFSSLIFQTVSRYFSNIYVPCVNIEYVVDGYRVKSFSEQILEIGETEVRDLDDDGIYRPGDNNIDPAIYLFTLSPTAKTATLTISGAKFHKDMPAMNMRFSNIPFEVDEIGNIVMMKENIVPDMLTGTNISSATATPMPTFPITNFRATYDSYRGLWVSYICSPDTEKFKGKFAVSMNNVYPETISGSSSTSK